MFKRLIENLGPAVVKTVVDNLITAMHERPNDFEMNRHYMKDLKTNYVYNISSDEGIHSPYEMKFGFWQGKRFKKTLSGLKAYQHKEKLDEVKI